VRVGGGVDRSVRKKVDEWTLGQFQEISRSTLSYIDICMLNFATRPLYHGSVNKKCDTWHFFRFTINELFCFGIVMVP
jgi:hypothetical protein